MVQRNARHEERDFVRQTPAARPRVPDDSPYAAQLRRGFRALRFQPQLEAGFCHHYSESNLNRSRLAALLAVVLLALFTFEDVYSMPFPGSQQAISMKLIAGPWLLAIWLASYTSRGARNATLLACLALAGLVACLMPIILHAQTVRGAYAYEALLLILIAAYFVAGLRFFHALAIGTGIVVLYAACQFWLDAPFAEWRAAIIYLIGGNALGAAGCYTQEYMARKNYLTTELLRAQAHIDGLTGLHNRRYLDTELPRLWEQARREGCRIAAAIFDVDYFKSYNDAYGHMVGDECLRAIGAILRSEARRPLDLAVRYGGEEFLIVWFDPTPAGIVEELVERVRQRVEALAIPHCDSPISDRVTVSGGGATAVPRKHPVPSDFLGWADNALYRAKHNGRNCTRVEPEYLGY